MQHHAGLQHWLETVRTMLIRLSREIEVSPKTHCIVTNDPASRIAGVLISGVLEETTTMTLGEKVRMLRNQLNLTQEDLGNLLYLQRAVVSHIENERREPATSTLIKLSSLFKVSVDYLVGATNQIGYAVLWDDAMPKPTTSIIEKRSLIDFGRFKQ